MRTFRFLGAFITVALCCATGVHAQEAVKTIPPADLSDITSPSECKRVLADRSIAKRQAGMTPTEVMADTIDYKETAARCAAKFDVTRIDTADLLELASLYIGARQFDKMHIAIQRRIDEAASVNRPGAVVEAVEFYTSSFMIDTLIVRFPQVLQYLSEVDRFGDPFIEKRLKAYRSLMWFLRADEQQRVVDSIVTLADRVNAKHKRAATDLIDEVYSLKVKTAIRDGRTDDVPSIMNEAKTKFRELGDTEGIEVSAASSFKYVGNPAPVLNVDHWLTPGPDSGKIHDYRNKITIIQTTATWCGWCKRGYPILRKIAAKYRGAVQPVLITYLEGSQGLNGAGDMNAELAKMRAHWIVDSHIDFPVYVVNGQSDDSSQPGAQSQTGRNNPIFKAVGGIGFPKYIVVDGQGIVRYIQLGHSFTLEQDLDMLIQNMQAQQRAFQKIPFNGASGSVSDLSVARGSRGSKISPLR